MSALYRFEAPQSEAAKKSGSSSNAQPKQVGNEEIGEEDQAFFENQEFREWIYDDPELPTAFRDNL